MKKVAACFSKDVLRGITFEDILCKMDELREKAGDRAVLRAIHFINEDERVDKCVSALKNDDIDTFLDNIKDSGNSSFKFLQNVYCSKDTMHQNVSLALAVSEALLSDNGVCRVHGGGFAGTVSYIQHLEPNADVVDGIEIYKRELIKLVTVLFSANLSLKEHLI